MATTHQEELDQLLIYSGKALIKSIVHTEGATAIEVRLTPESVSHPIKVKSADEIIIPFSYRPSASHLVKIFVDSKEYLGILKSVIIRGNLLFLQIFNASFELSATSTWYPSFVSTRFITSRWDSSSSTNKIFFSIIRKTSFTENQCTQHTLINHHLVSENKKKQLQDKRLLIELDV